MSDRAALALAVAVVVLGAGAFALASKVSAAHADAGPVLSVVNRFLAPAMAEGA